MFLTQNKVDISVSLPRRQSYWSYANIQSMSEQDQKAFKMYGKVPGKNLLTKMQKVSYRLRYFRELS